MHKQALMLITSTHTTQDHIRVKLLIFGIARLPFCTLPAVLFFLGLHPTATHSAAMWTEKCSGKKNLPPALLPSLYRTEFSSPPFSSFFLHCTSVSPPMGNQTTKASCHWAHYCPAGPNYNAVVAAATAHDDDDGNDDDDWVNFSFYNFQYIHTHTYSPLFDRPLCACTSQDITHRSVVARQQHSSTGAVI